jgi:Ca-activated chloride channel family protein
LPRKTDFRRWLLSIGTLFALGMLGLSPQGLSSARGQQKAGQQEERKRPVKPELESKSPQGEKTKDFRIGVNVDLVVIHTSITDKNGMFVTGLKKDHFRLFEDNIAQNIQSFSQEDVPVSLGIVLDTSGSMRDKIDRINQAALAFIKASNPDDEEFLIGFNSEVELLEDFTSDIDLISDTLNNTIVTGGTALYDAIYLAVQKAQTGSKPKKAIILITDGEDRDSYYKLDEMVAKVQESDVQIYSIGFLNAFPDKGLFGRWSKSEPEKAQEALKRISEETGARAFFPKDISEIDKIVAQVAHELRSQYSISYTSSNSARDGTWRRVKLALDLPIASSLHVRYRSGYFAAKPADSGK